MDGINWFVYDYIGWHWADSTLESRPDLCHWTEEEAVPPDVPQAVAPVSQANARLRQLVFVPPVQYNMDLSNCDRAHFPCLVRCGETHQDLAVCN